MGSCIRRTPGATSVTSVVASSCSCLRGLLLAGRLVVAIGSGYPALLTAWSSGGLEELLPVPGQLGHRLLDVVEGTMVAGLGRGGVQGAWIPPARELLDR